MCLPLDCSDLMDFEWSEPVAVAAPKPKKSFKDFEKSVATVALPAPIQFKSLAETFADLVSKVTGYRKPNPLASAYLSSALTKSNSHS